MVEPQQKTKIKTNLKMAAGLSAGGVLLLVLAASLWMGLFLSRPAGPDPTPRIFAIAPGQGLAAIARNLARDGLITDPLPFIVYARYKGAATRLKAGEYELSATLTPVQVLDLVISGKVLLYRLTLPEGWTMDQMAGEAQKAGICSADDFLALCRNREFIRDLDLPGITLEGYLFPDTYLYPRSLTCQTLIKTMTDSFKKVFIPKWQARAKELGLSLHDIVTLASMIEKETGDPAERALISSVFHNRLKKGMRLESDPTVIYGQEDYDGRIRYRHLRRLTPYNTYQIQGLPLGPIANPGAKALEAALYPALSDFLYFVSKNDTTHAFSKTLEAHNQAVRKYQLNR